MTFYSFPVRKKAQKAISIRFYDYYMRFSDHRLSSRLNKSWKLTINCRSMTIIGLAKSSVFDERWKLIFSPSTIFHPPRFSSHLNTHSKGIKMFETKQNRKHGDKWIIARVAWSHCPDMKYFARQINTAQRKKNNRRSEEKSSLTLWLCMDRKEWSNF